MLYCFFLMILCFVGLTQSNPIYFVNDLKKDVHVRCFQEDTEIKLTEPVKHTYTLGGREVEYNILLKNMGYLIALKSKSSPMAVEMIIPDGKESLSKLKKGVLDMSQFQSDNPAQMQPVYLSSFFQKAKL